MGVLWGLALLGLLMLPSDYRAGGEMAHGHSLAQLWIDAADGHVNHHHERGAINRVAIQDWLDPGVSAEHASGSSSVATAELDIGDQHDSSPTPGGVHLLLVALVMLSLAPAGRQFVAHPEQALPGQRPSVLLPPPRWTCAA